MQDRAEILSAGERVIIAVADGAGGIGGGAAAETFIYEVKKVGAELTNPGQCQRLLLHIDSELAKVRDGGETTGIVAWLAQTWCSERAREIPEHDCFMMMR